MEVVQSEDSIKEVEVTHLAILFTLQTFYSVQSLHSVIVHESMYTAFAPCISVVKSSNLSIHINFEMVKWKSIHDTVPAVLSRF